jgi:carbon storage regulator
MLILMRRAGESIHIGQNIVVTLVSLDRNRARIGIQAPREITVDREEIAKKKQNGEEPPLEQVAKDEDESSDDNSDD